MRNVAVLSHIGDIDGVGATALLKMKYKMPASNIFFTSHDLADLKKAYSGLKRLFKKGTLFFITDMNPSRDTAKFYEEMVKQVESKEGHVIWFDHHSWSDRSLKEIAAKCDIAVVGENKRMCATQLVQRFAKLNSRFAKEFTELVYYTDFYLSTKNKKYQKFIEEYKLSIGYYTMNNAYGATHKNLRHLAGVIASGRFTDKKIHVAAMKFKALNEKRTREMLSNLYPISSNLVIGFSKQVDSSDACHAIMEKSGADVVVLVKTDHGHCGIRSREADTVRFSNILGGGGHPHASGFSIDVKKYNHFTRKSDREVFAKFLRRAAEKADLI
jgi:oligoribonuclease NrnB/cAMP/cGMP phosphodiesterase (DHH superfamily)